MPLSLLKRKARRLSRRARSWSTIAQLTLMGNEIEERTPLKNCKNPVLMLYGYGATRRTLAILEKRLKKEGYKIISVRLGGFFDTFNTASIEESARHIDTKIEKLYKKYHMRGKLTIIGHSKGGLIGQYYIKFLNGGKRTKCLITLGTPHNGTPWCFLTAYTPLALLSKSLAQMSPTSSFIKKLKETPFPKTCRVFSIYSKEDIASPFPCAILDEAPNVKNIEVYGVTHAELLIKKNVLHAILHGLRNEMPESWTASSRKNYEEHVHKGKFTLIK